jgi:3'-phosphoadenosine 5'-phosphosulfate sulfotransferase (PAPS reductase)/FAD synthetase
MSLARIKEWYNYWDGMVYVAFSGGKDSTVLLHLVRRQFPDVPAVFINTGLEYPEIRQFVNTVENVVQFRPAMPFDEVIDKYGYPVVSKEVSQKVDDARRGTEKLRQKRLYGDEHGNGKLPEKWKFLIGAPFKISATCCYVMKKRPSKRYEKQTGLKPMVGTMAGDSRLRKMSYLQTGCNSFEGSRPMSMPIAFWTEQDVQDYLRKYNVPYSSIYDIGYSHTGCMFCMFGADQEKCPNRFQRMRVTHPKQWDFCINRLGCGKVLDYIGVPYDNSIEQLGLF